MRYWATYGVLGLLALLLCAGPVSAEQEQSNSRRTWGLALFASSAVLLKKGWDFHRQADEFYDLYRQTNDDRAAEDFFDRADNCDVKSQMSFLVAGTFALAGWQFWSWDARERRETGAKILSVEVVPQVELNWGRVGLVLKRRFL